VNISNLDLNLLLVFEAIRDERSVSGAARRLRRTQPAVSNALNRLREAFDDALFVRVGHGMQPTPLAEQIGAGVGEALHRLRDTLEQQPAFDAATSRRSFRVTATDYGTFVLMPVVTRLLQERAPHVDVRVVTSRDKAHELDQVLAGSVDLAFGVYDTDIASLRRERLLHERFVVVARKGHPGIRGRLSLRAYARHPHVLVSPAGDDKSIVDDRLAEAGEQRRVAMTVPHFAAAMFIVARTDHVVTVAERVARRLARAASVQVLPCPVRLSGFWLSMAWNHRMDTDSAHLWLRQAVRDAVLPIAAST
jgi:DNA-binding transcriptional LysR family regulator